MPTTWRTLLGAGTVGLAFVVSSGGAAHAAAPASTSCTTGTHHRSSACAATIDRASVRPGGQVQIYGSGFHAGERVTVALRQGREFLATLRADADGSTQAELLIPTTAKLGRNLMTITGHSSQRQLTAPIRIGARTHSDGVGVGQSSSGAMVATASLPRSSDPFTGAGTAIPLAAAGAAMMLAGGLTLMSVRHRRRPDLSR